MHEDLIKRLRAVEKMLTTANFSEASSLISQAADAIDELTRENESPAKSVNEASEILRRRWIPVTERLPEIDEKHHCSKDVLAYLKDGGMCFTALEENIFGQACFECERNPAFEEEMIVTHWMPLPEPPKEET